MRTSETGKKTTICRGQHAKAVKMGGWIECPRESDEIESRSGVTGREGEKTKEVAAYRLNSSAQTKSVTQSNAEHNHKKPKTTTRRTPTGG